MFTDKVLRSKKHRTVGEILLEILQDGQYHSAWELEEFLPNREWVRAMRELSMIHYSFERLGHSFRIKVKPPWERLWDPIDLFANIDLSKPEPEAVVSLARKVAEDSSSRSLSSTAKTGFDVSTDQMEDVTDGLKISETPGELVLSASDSTTMTAAVLAKKGSGKTYLGMVLVEEFLSRSDLQVPVVIVDPTGVWWSLRVMADGTASSLSVLILGGSHGDLEINCKQGLQVADAVHELWPRSVVLDLSLMSSSEQHEFVADFGQRIYALNVRSPLHMIVDEADEFAPQALFSSAHQRRSLEIMDRIVRRGRTKGFGVTLITQRSAVISKNVLSQTDSLFLLNMVSPSDLDAADSWMKNVVRVDQRVSCLRDLPNLPPGTAYFMQTGAVPKFRRFVIRKKRTFDASCTPKPGEIFTQPDLAPVEPEVMSIVRRCLKEGDSTVASTTEILDSREEFEDQS